MIGKILKKGDIVIYESTVYPGLTEEICVPEDKITLVPENMDFITAGSSDEEDQSDTLSVILADLIRIDEMNATL